jgi:hypothetical protein
VLINRRYSWRGYGNDHQIPATPHHATFTASNDYETLGTITLAVDSAMGLAADATFKEELDDFRRVPGTTVCELTKLAFESALPAKPMLAALFHIVFIHGQLTHDCTDLFIEVNPRHRRYYETMLGFTKVGPLKVNASVAAPSQLMWLRICDIRDRIDEAVSDANNSACRSLYPFFFSCVEEQAIHARLNGAKAPQADRDTLRDAFGASAATLN